MSEIIPKHIAIIMDGNRRWAKARGLSPWQGHEQGVEIVHNLMDWLEDAGVKYCTLYTFSSENQKRDVEEVAYLFKLMVKAAKLYLQEIHERGIKFIVSGQIEKLPVIIQKVVSKAVELTKDNTKGVLNLALNYGGRAEIVDATRRIIGDNIESDQISEELFNKYLYQSGALPDPELIIRTGGHKRLSNFLPWQSVYSELYFTDTLWPDFSKKDLEAALEDFANRKRNFGK